MKENLSEGFPVFDFQEINQITTRTSKSLEKINKEIKRLTKVVGVFSNEASCLRSVSALLLESSEECRIGEYYYTGKLFDYERTINILVKNL